MKPLDIFPLAMGCQLIQDSFSPTQILYGMTTQSLAKFFSPHRQHIANGLWNNSNRISFVLFLHFIALPPLGTFWEERTFLFKFFFLNFGITLVAQISNGSQDHRVSNTPMWGHHCTNSFGVIQTHGALFKDFFSNWSPLDFFF